MTTPQDNTELYPILTVLCSRARLAYKSDEPFKKQAQAKDEATAALLAWRSKYAREVATKAIGGGEDDNVPNYLGGGKNPVVQTRNDLRAEQHQTLDNLLQEE
jgi:hypothetical protein